MKEIVNKSELLKKNVWEKRSLEGKMYVFVNRFEFVNKNDRENWIVGLILFDWEKYQWIDILQHSFLHKLRF